MLENTLQYDPHEDQIENKQMLSQLEQELEPKPNVKDHYTGAEILLFRRDKMATGNVVAQNCDASGDVMGRACINPILDSRMYQVKFARNKVTEVTANVTAESMYAQYDADWNECYS